MAPYHVLGLQSRGEQKHLVLEGGSADRFSPYATSHKVSYRPFTFTSDAVPFDEFTSGYKNAVVDSQTGLSLDITTEANSSWKRPPAYTPSSPMSRVATEPAFFPTEEHIHGYSSGPRIMPPDVDPAARFATPPMTAEPAPIYMHGVHAGTPDRAGGFNKGNMNPIGTAVVNPPPTASPLPNLTAAQSKKLGEDSFRRLELSRDYYDNPFQIGRASCRERV